MSRSYTDNKSTLDQETITGEVLNITYRSDESGWTVFKIFSEEENKAVTATGSIAEINEGSYLCLTGNWVKHPSFGRQFKFSYSQASAPTSKTAIARYLASGVIKGIGKKTAQKIVDTFGTNTINVLDNEPERLTEVESIGKKTVAKIIKAWKENQSFRNIELYLSEFDITPTYIHRIIKFYGKDTVELLKENPYRLARDIRGIGFIKADTIALKMGIEENSLERLKAAIHYILSSAEDDGHCYLTTKQMVQKLIQILKIDESEIYAKVYEAVKDLNESGFIVTETEEISDEETQSIHYLSSLLLAEESSAAKMQELLNTELEIDIDRVHDWLSRYLEATKSQLSETQKQAVVKAVSHRVFILTGGPGVGKTTTANTIIKLLLAMGKSIQLAAPTGRAAQRLSEVSGETAKTIHRLLEWNPAEGGFLRDSDNPILCDAIVIDEASMLDVRLFHSLIKAVSPRSQIILIGDVDQLPSVGAGNVLRDLINSDRIPFTMLKEVFRQAATSKIISTAHDINMGKTPEFVSDEISDCQFIEVENPYEIKEAIKDLMNHHLPEKGHYDPVRDVQILTPMNKGELGTEILNQELQELLNPASENTQELKRDTIVFRSGDKVIQSANNYDLNVYNGDIGIVQHAGVQGGKIIISFGERLVTYEKEDSFDLKHAYAITIHKSQGSEFHVVIIPVCMQHYLMLQRNLIYTALTRAKRLAIFVGTRSALDQAVRTQTSLKRQTKLMERIQSYESNSF